MSDDIQLQRRERIAQAVRDIGAKTVYLALGFDTLVDFHLWINAREFIDRWDVARISGATEQQKRRAWVHSVIAAYGHAWVSYELGFSQAECERWRTTGGITEADIILLQVRLDFFGCRQVTPYFG